VQDCAVASVLTDYDAAPPILSRQVIEGDPAQVLLRIARNADYLVVGSGRKGPMKRLLAGSVSEFCVRHAACPVLVVPAPMNDNMPEAQLQPACP
jgi:nucleotide-binding universal stress UspA family protein